MTPPQWPADLTRFTGTRVRQYRVERGLSADQLAQAIDAAGVRYTRAQVTNLEANRRTTITVGELLVLARVLDVPPVALLLPLGDADDEVEVLPGVRTSAWAAYQWITGEAPLGQRGTDSDRLRINTAHTDPERFLDAARPVNLLRRYSAEVTAFGHWRHIDSSRAMSAVENIVQIRREMREHGIDVPGLTGVIADAVAEHEGAE